MISKKTRFKNKFLFARRRRRRTIRKRRRTATPPRQKRTSLLSSKPTEFARTNSQKQVATCRTNFRRICHRRFVFSAFLPAISFHCLRLFLFSSLWIIVHLTIIDLNQRTWSKHDANDCFYGKKWVQFIESIEWNDIEMTHEQMNCIFFHCWFHHPKRLSPARCAGRYDDIAPFVSFKWSVVIAQASRSLKIFKNILRRSDEKYKMFSIRKWCI